MIEIINNQYVKQDVRPTEIEVLALNWEMLTIEEKTNSSTVRSLITNERLEYESNSNFYYGWYCKEITIWGDGPKSFWKYRIGYFQKKFKVAFIKKGEAHLEINWSLYKPVNMYLVKAKYQELKLLIKQ